jgi:hypothetical protein
MTLRLPFATLAALAALAAGAPAALGSGADAASTHAYLEANYTLIREADARIGQAQAQISGVVHQVRRECPQAAAESPQDTDSEQLSNETIGAVVMSVVPHALPQIGRFVRAVAPLRWSSRGLTRTIHSYAAKLKVLSRLAPPHLCADVKAWTASGFKTLPAATVAFDRRFMPAWVGAGELPDALKAIASAEDRALVRRTVQLEARWAEFEAREVESWGAIMDTMVLQP